MPYFQVIEGPFSFLLYQKILYNGPFLNCNATLDDIRHTAGMHRDNIILNHSSITTHVPNTNTSRP
jgi:hypothetical protein